MLHHQIQRIEWALTEAQKLTTAYKISIIYYFLTVLIGNQFGIYKRIIKTSPMHYKKVIIHCCLWNSQALFPSFVLLLKTLIKLFPLTKIHKNKQQYLWKKPRKYTLVFMTFIFYLYINYNIHTQIQKTKQITQHQNSTICVQKSCHLGFCLFCAIKDFFRFLSADLVIFLLAYRRHTAVRSFNTIVFVEK